MKDQVMVYYHSFAPCRPAQHHEQGRRLLRQALWEEYRIELTEEMITRTANGKPCFKELPIFFNISHCSGMAVCALSDVPVGVDVESGRRVTDSLICKVLSPWERTYVKEQDSMERFLELWTLKESWLKMTGDGLRVPLDTVSFRFREPEAEKELPATSDRAKGFAEITDEMAGAGTQDRIERKRTPDQISCSRPGHFGQWKLDGSHILALCTREQCSFAFKGEISEGSRTKISQIIDG